MELQRITETYLTYKIINNIGVFTVFFSIYNEFKITKIYVKNINNFLLQEKHCLK